jgi:hypothetical protein
LDLPQLLNISLVSAGERVWNVSPGVPAIPWEAEELIPGGWKGQSVLRGSFAVVVLVLLSRDPLNKLARGVDSTPGIKD